MEEVPNQTWCHESKEGTLLNQKQKWFHSKSQGKGRDQRAWAVWWREGWQGDGRELANSSQMEKQFESSLKWDRPHPHQQPATSTWWEVWDVTTMIQGIPPSQAVPVTARKGPELTALATNTNKSRSARGPDGIFCPCHIPDSAAATCNPIPGHLIPGEHS